MIRRGLAVIAAITACSVLTAIAAHPQTKPLDDSAEAGRILALRACTGCHIVASDQPYMPIYKGARRPPDFKDIANKSDSSVGALRNYLATLPAVPKSFQMANPDLSEEQMRDVSNYIMTLRDMSSTSSR